jgi:Putative lumazine-binding
MKTKISSLILITFITMTTTLAQTKNEEAAIKQTIEKFVLAADKQDDKALDMILDVNFRLSLNQMFGSKDVVNLNKEAYLSKIKAKEFGGDKREIKIEHLLILNNNASLQATFKGAKMTVLTFIQLVKTHEGEWKILNDLPSIL